jgi:hypothetical protein
VDAEAANAWHRWSTLAEFAGGKSDDVSLRELLDAAGDAKMDARTPRGFIDVVKLDKMRRGLASSHAPRLDDGSAVPGASRGASAKTFPPRAAASVRVLPARSTVDAEVLQALVFPAVGKLLPRSADEGVPPSARGSLRALPRALDVAAWLGAPEAPSLLHDAGDDAYEGYQDQVAMLETRRAPEGAKHDSVYLSSLDAIAAYVHASAADPVQPSASTSAWRLRKLESALTAWVTLRHDALAFARFPAASTTPPLSARSRAGDGLPAFVEPHPEAIGKLLSVVRQTARGLRALGHVPGESPATALLDASEKLLADAFAVAMRQANDQALSPEERDAMHTFPGRLLALEGALAGSRAADASLAVDVHTDLVAGSALVEASGDLDDVYLLVREPRSGRLVLAGGAVGSHYEITAPARDRPTDGVWRAQLHGVAPPERAAFTRAYLAPEGEPAEADAAAEASRTD